MANPIDQFLNSKLRELTQPVENPLTEPEQERHLIYVGALSAIMRHYWCGNKRGLKGTYPRNPDPGTWSNSCPNLGNEYRGHNIAALAVDDDGLIIDFDFNHNQLFDSSVEHAEARLVRRVFSLTQIQDSWNIASADNPADKYSNALSKVTVYTSLESCTQCTGIMMLGRVKEVVYLQRDPGMYNIGDFLHTLTARKEPVDFIKAPMPIPATYTGSEIVEKLDQSFTQFALDVKDTSKPPFHLSSSGREDRSSSITSFLSTEEALKAFSEAADQFFNTRLKHPEFKPSPSLNTNQLSNVHVYQEALQFVEYAVAKGHRGTPHK